MRAKKIFLALSALILLFDAIFVFINYKLSGNALQQSLREQGEQRSTAFELAISLTLENMLQLATYVGNDPQIQQLFLKGKRAVDRANGRMEGPEVMALRQELLDLVYPSWQEMTRNFRIRQLHFHLGPGSRSYLRVHRPDKFGDRMDSVRYTIVDTNAELTPRTGFETGRVNSGLRGIMPMFAVEPNSGKKVHVGALEAGTSFSFIINQLSESMDSEVAILLRKKHVEENMWPDFINRNFIATLGGCGCYLEATSSQDIRKITAHGGMQVPAHGVATSVWQDAERYMAVARFALRDYRAKRHPELEHVGGVFVWWDVTQEILTFEQAQRVNLFYAVVGYILMELLLYFGFRFGVSKLETEVQQRTHEIATLNEQLYTKSITDGLTGLNNRRHFMDCYRKEEGRARRHRHHLALMLLDIDRFKEVNDTHGHAVGDEVLRMVADAIKATVRISDLCCRFGGEEFAILLPEAELSAAHQFAERLRLNVADLVLNRDGYCLQVTTSIGVALWRTDGGWERLMQEADEALYAAKAAGRNRVIIHSSEDGF